jgi:DNA-binding MarR family transcriptional regulator
MSAVKDRKGGASAAALELEFQLGQAAAAGLGVSALRVMLALARKPLFMGDAADATDSSTASVTGLIDRLVEKGFVARRRSQADRRSIELALTARGEATLMGIVGEGRGA